MERLQIEHTLLEIVLGDITVQTTEAVVNAANKQLAPGGGVAGAIHRAAGPGLWAECQLLGGCQTGEAKLTSGHNLKASFIIHTVGPVFTGSPDDPEKLRTCYHNCLNLADNHGIRSICFPAISTGAFGYPVMQAASISLRTVKDYILGGTNITLVRFALFTWSTFEIYRSQLHSLAFSE
jgi:O-acetyl-ADP-ribose deacetylase (regulator of RNase III)